MTTIDQNVGAELRRQRKRRCWAITDLAAAAGISANQIQKYESGKSSINMRMLMRIERGAGISSLQLLNAARRA